MPRRHQSLLPLLCALLASAGGLRAQADAVRTDSTTTVPRTSAAVEAGLLSVPMLAGGAVLAALGGQIIQSPTAWPRTAGGFFARRLGDQAGFVIVEETLRSATLRLTGWEADGRPCEVDWVRLAPCAAVRAFGAHTEDGRRRVNLPLVVGIVGGTLASLAWRPEGRASGAKARNFVATRLVISVGVPVLLRTVTELRRSGAAR
jgi:hypothetical protein